MQLCQLINDQNLKEIEKLCKKLQKMQVVRLVFTVDMNQGYNLIHQCAKLGNL
jgi:hypothetical protein